MSKKEFFLKKRGAREKRKSDFKDTNTEAYLVVTEGEKTEPLYLNGLKKEIQKRTKGHIDINPSITVTGEGMHTMSLVERASYLNKTAGIIYNQVWIVMDKDDFCDFDEAISAAKRMGFNVAWSNQSFEYWIYLHFAYSDTALHRKEWYNKLNNIFREKNINGGKYTKNFERIFDELCKKGDLESAIKNAKQRMKDFDENRVTPSRYDPGTTVHFLVEELIQYLK